MNEGGVISKLEQQLLEVTADRDKIQGELNDAMELLRKFFEGSIEMRQELDEIKLELLQLMADYERIVGRSYRPGR